MVDEGVREAVIVGAGQASGTPPEALTERTGVPPKGYKNRASGETSLLSSAKARYLDVDAWPPPPGQIAGSDLIPLTAHPI